MATPPFRRPLEEMLEWSSQDILEQRGQVSRTFWSQGKRTSAKSAKTAQMSKRTEKTYRVHLAAVGPYLLAFAFFLPEFAAICLCPFFSAIFSFKLLTKRVQIFKMAAQWLEHGCKMGPWIALGLPEEPLRQHHSYFFSWLFDPPLWVPKASQEWLQNIF